MAPAEREARRSSTVPVGLIAVGMVCALGCWQLYAGSGGEATARTIAMMGGLLGVALLAAGLVSWLFMRATQRSFEWMVAWRYLRARRRSWVALAIGAGVVLVGVGLLVAAQYVGGREPLDELIGRSSGLQRQLRLAGGVTIGLGSWVLFFGILMLAFSVFTSISVLGVFLGTEVLVVVLSVMGGFEQDLRRKILGARAHVTVTRPNEMFTRHDEVVRQVKRVDGVAAVAPYIEGEVMITSQSNLSGVLLRGIDPRRVSRVTDLPAYLRAEGGAGKLDYLVRPEKLAKIPAGPVIRTPLQDKPLGAEDAGPASTDGGPAQPNASGEGGVLPPDSGAAPRDRGALQQRPLERVDGGVATRVEAGSGPTSGPSADGSVPQLFGKPEVRRPADGSDYKGIGPRVEPRPIYPGVIVGAELARNLRLYIGDDVNLVAPLGGMSPAGPIPKSRPFRVAGIFYSGMYEYDTKFAYVTIPVAQAFLGLDDEITGLEVKAADVAEATELARRIDRRLGKSYEVKDWQQLNRNLFSALKLEKVVMFIVLTFIVVVAAFAIIITLTMIVLERTREIAALKALGASHRSLLRIFVYAGMYIGIIGMLVGILEGTWICALLSSVGLPLDPEVYYISRLPVRVDPFEIALVGLFALVLSFLATVHPALLASRLKPVEGLRYE